jgi:hypothetical protein
LYPYVWSMRFYMCSARDNENFAPWLISFAYWTNFVWVYHNELFAWIDAFRKSKDSMNSQQNTSVRAIILIDRGWSYKNSFFKHYLCFSLKLMRVLMKTFALRWKEQFILMSVYYRGWQEEWVKGGDQWLSNDRGTITPLCTTTSTQTNWYGKGRRYDPGL